MLNTQEAVDIHTKNIYYNFEKHFFKLSSDVSK